MEGRWELIVETDYLGGRFLPVPLQGWHCEPSLAVPVPPQATHRTGRALLVMILLSWN